MIGALPASVWDLGRQRARCEVEECIKVRDGDSSHRVWFGLVLRGGGQARESGNRLPGVLAYYHCTRFCM